MVENLLYLQFLLSGAFGFVENTYIQLQDCCKYKQEGIVFIIDRENSDYEEARQEGFKENVMSTISIHGAIMNNEGFPIVASKSVVKTLLNYIDFHPELIKRKEYIFSHLEIRELEDFYVLFPPGTPTEGFNIKNLRQIQWEQVYHYVPKCDHLMSIEKVLEKLFKRDSHVSWMVYCNGHGLINDSIAGLQISDFKKFLAFLEKKINTKILLYNSCYCGGINKIKAFEEQANDKSMIQRNYPFPIIALSPTDANASMTSKYPIDFDRLFSSLTNVKFVMPDYYTILIDALFLKSHSSSPENPEIVVGNFPQIRLPGTEWFSIAGINRIAINKNDEYLVISEVMGKTREKELKIKKTAKAIFLYTPIIPFKLTIPKTKAQMRMVCMDASNAYHFSEIDAPDLTFIDLCKIFAPLSDNKDITFYIDTLIYKDKIMHNCVLDMFLEEENRFTFQLVRSRDAFFADTDPGFLYRTTIDVQNYNEAVLEEEGESIAPESHKFDSLSELKQVLAQRVQDNKKLKEK